MPNATLRKVGVSVMVAIPPALLDAAGLRVDQEVGLVATDGSIVMKPVQPRRYTLAELIARCDPSAPEEDREWVDAPPVGDEIL